MWTKTQKLSKTKSHLLTYLVDSSFELPLNFPAVKKKCAKVKGGALSN